VVDNPNLLPQAEKHIEVKSSTAGYINSVNAEDIGVSAMLLGAGRKTKNDSIDFSAGITMVKKIGDWVDEGDTCAYFTQQVRLSRGRKAFQKCFCHKNTKPEPIKYVHCVID